MTKSGTGTLILNGANTYSGGTTINGGTLQIGAGGSTGSIAGNVTDNGTLAFNRSDDFTFGGVISGTGGMVNNGYILRLSAAQTYTGPTIINFGYLVLPTTVDQGLSAASIVNVATGSFLDLSSRAQTFGGLVGGGTVYSYNTSAGSLTVGVATGQSYSFSGTLGGSTYPNFAFAKSGGGTQILSGANTYTGGTTINGGTLQIGDGITDGSISSSSSITDNGALVYNLLGNQTYAHGISGTGSLTKSGPGTLTLTANESYSGGTTVSSGTLLVSGSISGTTSVALNGGTLKFGFTGTVPGTVNTAATLSLGGGTLNVNGTNQTLSTLTLTGGASTIDFGAGNTGCHLTLGDSHLLAANWASGATLSIIDWNGNGFTGGGADELLFGNGFGLTLAQVNAITFLNPAGFAPGTYSAALLSTGELVAVPEPGALVSMLGGLGVLGLVRRRRK
jgi:autotransporter-associated beta strand protein